MRLILSSAIVVILLATNTAIALFAYAYDTWPWFIENGIIETIQLVVMLIAFLNFVRLTRAPTPFVRYFFATAMLMCLIGILRELDFDPYGPWWKINYVLHVPVRIIMVVITVPVVFIFVQRCIELPRAIPRLVFGTGPGWLWCAGFVVIASGQLFEERYIEELVSDQWEEVIELNGFILIALSTLVPFTIAEQAVAPLLLKDDGTG